ncbi:hypothetical protein D3C81_1629490 [compost metagenome]
MAQHVDTLRIPRSDDRQRDIALDDIRGIHQLAVDLASQSGLGQTGTDGLRNFGHTDRLLERTLTTVGKSNDGHGASCLSGDPYQRPHGWDEPVNGARRENCLTMAGPKRPSRHTSGDHWKNKPAIVSEKPHRRKVKHLHRHTKAHPETRRPGD